MSWLCHCGLVNGGTNKQCSGSRTKRDEWKEIGHYQVSENSPDWIMATLVAKELGMTKEEELFAKFYNLEKVYVKDMDHIQLREHREELQTIAFEAKARLVAADDETRERTAKTNKKEWLVTDTKAPYDVSAAINVVKTRASRMSKMDKMRKQLLDSNIDESIVNEMIRNLENKATDSKLKTVTFNKPSTEISVVQVRVPKSESDGIPFDPSALKFGK